MKSRLIAVGVAATALAIALAGCGSTGGTGGDGGGDDVNVNVGSDLTGKKICFGFSGSETEFWAAGIASITSSLEEVNATVIEHNSNEDPNKQLEQIRDCITQGVDGIIVIPQDGESANTMIDEANEAGIPIGIFNRPPADRGRRGPRRRRRQPRRVGADHAVHGRPGRRDRGEGAAAHHGRRPRRPERGGAQERLLRHHRRQPRPVRDPIEVETKWDAATGKANLEAAMQANPNVGLIFTSSDFLYPQIQAVLEPLGKWEPVGEEGHVIMGGIDGDNRRAGC